MSQAELPQVMIGVKERPAVPFGLAQRPQDWMRRGETARFGTRQFGKGLGRAAPVHGERSGIDRYPCGIGAEVQVPHPPHRQVQDKRLDDSIGRPGRRVKRRATEDGVVRRGKMHEHLVWRHSPPATPRVRAHPLDAPRQLCKNVGVCQAPAPFQAKPNRIHRGKVDYPIRYHPLTTRPSPG